MILRLLNLLFLSLGLGYDNQAPRNSLYPRREPEALSISPAIVLLLLVVGVIFLVLLIFLFTGVSAVESGTYYNGFDNVI